MKVISRRNFIKKSAVAGAALVSGGGSVLLTGTAADAKHTPAGLAFPPFLGKVDSTSMAMNLVAGRIHLKGIVEYRLYMDTASTKWARSEEIALAPFVPREILLTGLLPGSRYEYRFVSTGETSSFSKPLWTAHFSTPSSTPRRFSFALLADAHITPFHNLRREKLRDICTSIHARQPDLGVMLGDNVQTFSSQNGPMNEELQGPLLYANLRLALGHLPSEVPMYSLIGNWEGENGWNSEKERMWTRRARLAFLPTPDATTYPEGAGPSGDYYGFTRGDVLFLMLNVTGYTSTDQSWKATAATPEGWTLGEEQKSWLHQQLSRSKAKWKLIFIHHPVGGNAADRSNSSYGRGGGQAAFVGEQAQIHRWMKEYGVQAFFYGHDHVFTDIPVDGIHYICVGSAGAPWKVDGEASGYTEYLSNSGYAWVDVNSERLRVEYVTPDPEIAQGKVLRTIDIPA